MTLSTIKSVQCLILAPSFTQDNSYVSGGQIYTSFSFKFKATFGTVNIFICFLFVLFSSIYKTVPTVPELCHLCQGDYLNLISFPLFAVAADFNLLINNAEMNKYPFKKAVLSDCNKDINKRWRITFWVYSVDEGKLVRKFDTSVNKFNTIAERKIYARRRIEAINSLLEKGFHIDSSKKVKAVEAKTERENETQNQASNDYYTIKDATKFAISASNVAYTSKISYESNLRLFIAWCTERGIEGDAIGVFSKKDAFAYRDYLLKDNKVGKTINTKVACLKRLWNILIKREIIKDNPWTVLEKEKEIITNRNIAYTWSEVEKLSDIIKKGDMELWRFVSMIYHTLARPNEIRQMQVYNIHLAKKKIYLDAFKTKSKNERWINIHDNLIDTIIELIKNKSPKEYLFPGYEMGTCVSKNRMTEKHKVYLEMLELDDGEHTLYSWKHTGVVQAYEAGVDIKSIQQQCGHSSVLETDTYLKSLGLFNNMEIVLKQPSLP